MRRIAQDSTPRNFLYVGGPYHYPSFEDAASTLWHRIRDQHGDAKMISVKDENLGNIYWRMVVIIYSYDDGLPDHPLALNPTTGEVLP